MKRTVLILLLLTSVAQGATYYVASYAATGGDGSESSPFKTLADCDAVMVSGDTLRIWQGSVFREDLDLNDLDNIIVEAWGDGSMPMPVLYGDLVTENNAWDVNATYTNVYEYSTTQTIEEAYLSVWEDGTQLTYEPNIADCNDTAGTFWINGSLDGYKHTVAGAVTYCIHPTDSNSPATNGSVYSITDPTRTGYLYVGDNSIIRYCASGRQAIESGGIRAGLDTYILGCTAFQGVKHEALVASGTYTDCVVWHPADDARTNNIAMEFYTANGTSKYCLYDGCVVIGPGPSATQAVDAFSGHNSGAGTYYASWTARNSSAYNATSGFKLQATLVALDRCKVIDCTSAMWVQPVTSGTVRDCYVSHNGSNNTANASTAYALFTQDAPVTVSGLRAYMTYDNRTVIYPRADITITRSVAVVDSLQGSAWMDFLYPYSSSNTKPDISGVIFANLDADRVNWIDGLTGNMNTAWASNGNVISPETMNNWILGTSYSTMTAYLAAVRPTRESTTQVLDPQFTDPANGDFTVGNSTVAAMAVGLANTNVSYTAIPSVSTVLKFDWPGHPSFPQYPGFAPRRSGLGDTFRAH